MLIMTLLVAGACFAMFYVPITASGNLLATNAWEKDFSMRLRADQDMPDFEKVGQLAGEYRLTVEHWAETPLSVLGKDGNGQDIDENGKYIYYYQEVIADCTVIPASGYEALTGEHIDIPRGTYDECVDQDSPYGPDTETTLLTNMATGEALDVSFGDVHYSHTLSGLTVLNDEDFARISEGLGSSWQETFVQGIQNSCNPVFMDIGLRLGAGRFYDYFEEFGLMKLTNIDLPGEAGTIMHRKEDIGTVELATMTFGQSFQVTPIQMAVTVSSIVNGGNRVTPHVGTAVLDRDGNVVEEFDHEVESGIVSEETSETMRMLLESVVAEGSGKNAYLEGYSIGGKTATSQTLPRSANKYIASFLGFAPADDPQILGMVIIHDPQGVYYGGTIAAPVLRSIYDNVLPYLGIEKK